MKPKLKQKGQRLRLGDVVRIQDKGMEGEIAVVVEDDGHPEWPWCCMLVATQVPDRMRMEYWPITYERLGNVVELVALGQEISAIKKDVRKLLREINTKRP